MNHPPRDSTTTATGGTLTINRIACTGRGICAHLLPNTIRLDDWGYPIINDTPPPKRSLRAAVRLCPTGALRMEKNKRNK
ncbi:ferredoxin [Gordonia polyisoprenivorans]|uniref:ferredoxin n=1 Tax=Gordonia polyisoprenivorans TaxID=84595 RepID=UPI0009DB0C22|nr:ferredoxin [Gordonia polyisoprenivorans]